MMMSVELEQVRVELSGVSDVIVELGGVMTLLQNEKKKKKNNGIGENHNN